MRPPFHFLFPEPLMEGPRGVPPQGEWGRAPYFCAADYFWDKVKEFNSSQSEEVLDPLLLLPEDSTTKGFKVPAAEIPRFQIERGEFPFSQSMLLIFLRWGGRSGLTISWATLISEH